jgi:hypothetical protein
MRPERSFDGKFGPGAIRSAGGACCELLTIDTQPDARSVLHHAGHALLAMVDGPDAAVTVEVAGAQAFSGIKRPGSAGFFPADRRMVSGWPAMRLRYLLVLSPHEVIEQAVDRPQQRRTTPRAIRYSSRTGSDDQRDESDD